MNPVRYQLLAIRDQGWRIIFLNFFSFDGFRFCRSRFRRAAYLWVAEGVAVPRPENSGIGNYPGIFSFSFWESVSRTGRFYRRTLSSTSWCAVRGGRLCSLARNLFTYLQGGRRNVSRTSTPHLTTCLTETVRGARRQTLFPTHKHTHTTESIFKFMNDCKIINGLGGTLGVPRGVHAQISRRRDVSIRSGKKSNDTDNVDTNETLFVFYFPPSRLAFQPRIPRKLNGQTNRVPTFFTRHQLVATAQIPHFHLHHPAQHAPKTNDHTLNQLYHTTKSLYHEKLRFFPPQ